MAYLSIYDNKYHNEHIIYISSFEGTFIRNTFEGTYISPFADRVAVGNFRRIYFWVWQDCVCFVISGKNLRFFASQNHDQFWKQTCVNLQFAYQISDQAERKIRNIVCVLWLDRGEVCGNPKNIIPDSNSICNGGIRDEYFSTKSR